MKKVLSTALLTLLISLPALGADKKDLSKSPQAQAYHTLLKAVDAGDAEAYKKAMTKEARAEIDKDIKEMGMEPKQAMEMLKMMSPSDLKFTDLKVDGKKATLMATGTMMDEAQTGTIELLEEDGSWKVQKQSWTNKK